MSAHRLLVYVLVLSFLFLTPFAVDAQGSRKIQLPSPQTTGGKPLLTALSERRSTREFAKEKISEAVLANLLWAAFGVNRCDSKGRTAPSACNCQEIDIYVATEDGLYLYDAEGHALTVILEQDIRAETGYDFQGFVKSVPVNLIYVVDKARQKRMEKDLSADERAFYYAIDTGYISQNVYLFCASEDLATVARGLVDRSALGKIMQLRPDQEVVLTQSVGYPEKDLER